MIKRIFHLHALLLVFAVPNIANALQLTESVELHGFASQGYVYSPDNPYATENTENGSFDFRDFGLNLSWDINESTRMTGQVLQRQVGDGFDNGANLDFLLLDHQFVQSDAGYFGVRIGRVRNSFGLYNASRDIPNARPGLNVPESIYFDSFRNAFISVDGLNVYGTHNSKLGLLEYSASFGKQKMNSEALEYYMVRKELDSDLQPENILMTNIQFHPQAVPSLKFGFSGLFTELKLQDGVSNEEAIGKLAPLYGTLTPEQVQLYILNNMDQFISEASLDIAFYNATIQYAFEDWIFSAEAMRIDVDATVEVLAERRGGKTHVDGFFLQAEWFPRHDIETLLRYEELDLGYQIALAGRDTNIGKAKGVTLGIKWHINAEWTLGTQVSRYEGYAWAPVYEDMVEPQNYEPWNVYRAALTLSLIHI